MKELKVNLRSPLMHNYSFTLRQYNRTVQLFSGELIIAPNVSLDHLWARFSIFKKGTNMQYRPYVLVNQTIDVCGLLNGTLKIKYLMFFLKDFKKSTNLVHPCPFSVKCLAPVSNSELISFNLSGHFVCERIEHRYNRVSRSDS